MSDRPIQSEQTGRRESDREADGFPSEPEPITRRERTERWFEVASGILLAVVAVAAA
jgi:hypothetical protein